MSRRRRDVALWLLVGLGGIVILAALAGGVAAIYGMMIEPPQWRWTSGPNPFAR